MSMPGREAGCLFTAVIHCSDAVLTEVLTARRGGGQIEPAAAPPYYWGFCLPPAEAATQASRFEAERQSRGSVAASVHHRARSVLVFSLAFVSHVHAIKFNIPCLWYGHHRAPSVLLYFSIAAHHIHEHSRCVSF